MAGGKSERMRASGAAAHKALAAVRGVTLLEWNVRSLVSHGFSDIVVAVNPRERPVVAAARACTAAVEHSGGTLRVYEETAPLGNIGAARETIGDASALLIVYVDNLAAIDLRRLHDFHIRGGFALTFATHVQSFDMPFGEVRIEGTRVTAYTEKPTLRFHVSSGTCVISQDACKLIPEGKPTSANALAELLLQRGMRIGAFEHRAPWIDINDTSALARAQLLVAEHVAEFGALASL